MFYFAFPPTFIIISLLLPLQALDVRLGAEQAIRLYIKGWLVAQVIILINLCVTSEIFSRGQAFLAQGTDTFFK